MKLDLRVLSPLLLLIAITIFSNQTSDKQDLAPVINKYPQVLSLVRDMPHMKFIYHNRVIDNRADTTRFIQFMLRKAAHVILYGIFGLSLIIMFSEFRFKITYAVLFSGGLLFLVACLDEYMQSSTGGRTGIIEDVFVDLIGFLIFANVALGIKLRKRRRDMLRQI